jgi:AcrR family transcriptional regulator
MEERARRIVESAVELAEKGGFEAVRLRDVASHAGVALGTVYRRFRSKEDLLLAALELEMVDLDRRVAQKPSQGESPLARITSFFQVATRALCRRPQLARALLRAVASGDEELTQKVAAFHTQMEDWITDALRGEAACTSQAIPSEQERALAYSLQLVWFASLVGWSGGLHGQAGVIAHTRTAAELMLRGVGNGAAGRGGAQLPR